MVQVIRKKLPFGQFGENFGRSLGETMEKEVGRGVRAQGLRGLIDQMQDPNAPAKTRAELMADLYSIPGMEAQDIETWTPALEDAIQAQAIRRSQGEGGQQGSQAQAVGASADSAVSSARPEGGRARPAPMVVDEESVTIEEQRPSRTILTEQDQQALQAQEVPIDDAMIDREAARLMREQPGRYPTTAALRSAAERNLQASNTQVRNSRAQANAKQALQAELEQTFQDRLNRTLQRAGIEESWKAVPEVFQTAIFSTAVDAVKNGANVANAAEKAAKEGLDVTSKLRNFYERGNAAFWGRGGDELIKDLKDYRSLFDKYGALREYDKELQAKGLSEHVSATVTRDLSDDAAKALARLDKYTTGLGDQMVSKASTAIASALGLGAPVAYMQESKQEAKRDAATEKVVDDLLNSMQPGDSFNAVALALSDAGFSDRVFWEKAKERFADSDELPDWKDEELRKAKPVRATLNDVWTAASHKAGGAKGKFGLWEAITRRVFNKR